MTDFDLIFDPDVKNVPAERVDFPQPLRARLDLPENYRASKDLLQAAKVAVLLRKPLLLTGLAGTGKTQLAFHLHWRLRFPGRVLMFETKSTSVGRDLFYTYDTLGRFHSAYTKAGSSDDRDYIRFNALGEAILRTRTPKDAAEWLSYKLDPPHTAPQPSVVLIDEIDKAPTDFHNDILNEIENLYFRVPELQNKPDRKDKNDRIAADRKDRNLEPVIILTSNSEKTLPAPFLRRCVYYHISFPSREELRNIIAARILEFSEEAREYPLLKDALEIFEGVRSLDLVQHPATAELLDWLLVLLRDFKPAERLGSGPEKLRNSLSTLRKSEPDQSKVKAYVDQWINKPQQN
jgi:MoxR-like ATPase